MNITQLSLDSQADDLSVICHLIKKV